MSAPRCPIDSSNPLLLSPHSVVLFKLDRIFVYSAIFSASSTSIRATLKPVAYDCAREADKYEHRRVTLYRALDRELSETCSLGRLGLHRQPFSRSENV